MEGFFDFGFQVNELDFESVGVISKADLATDSLFF